MAKANAYWMATAMAGRKLSRRLLELVRLRLAFHSQCRSCMAMRFSSAMDEGFTEDLVCSLEKPMEAPDLTPAEKAALEYADLFATNHFAINDETFAGLREHFTDGEIIDAIKLLAKTEGIWTEPAGGATLAATIKLLDEGRIPRDEEIVVSITGNGLKTQEAVIDEFELPEAIDAKLDAFDSLWHGLPAHGVASERHVEPSAVRESNREAILS